MPDNRHTRVSLRAYELWEQAGSPFDRALEHWLAAERDLKADDDAKANFSAEGAPPPEPRNTPDTFDLVVPNQASS
jgi:Protein of unknown function (DUF2934)